MAFGDPPAAGSMGSSRGGDPRSGERPVFNSMWIKMRQFGGFLAQTWGENERGIACHSGSEVPETQILAFKQVVVPKT